MAGLRMGISIFAVPLKNNMLMLDNFRGDNLAESWIDLESTWVSDQGPIWGRSGLPPLGGMEVLWATILDFSDFCKT